MKKRYLWFIAIILLVILFVPLPKGSYDDGGSREYEALTYKIIRWNRLSDRGTYRKTRLYWGADKHLSIDELFARENAAFAKEPPIAFRAQYIRTDGRRDGTHYPTVQWICSKNELNAYYEDNCSFYNLARRDGNGFLDACDRYDEAFFQNRRLIVVLLEESSGSVRHKVTSLTQNGDGKLTVNISSIIPEAGTCDMAQWHILIETTVDVATEQDIALSFLSDHTDNAIPLTTDAVFRGDTADVTVPLPDGWDFELLDDGMRFWPQGHKDDPLRLYGTTAFGVCGTGLRYDTITLGAYEAEQGTYDNHTLWDYIILPKELYSVGDYVILNEGADAWWDDYGDEAMTILADITVFEHVLPKEKAITLAKTICTVKYNTVNATYIAADLTWEVHFYMEDACGGGQVVTIDAISGEALETEYGE